MLRLPSSLAPKFSAPKRSVSNSVKNALYIDRGLLVLNKPSGLVCQFNRNEQGVSRVLRSCMSDLREQFDLKDDLYPVHRLDKVTTGALALAFSPAHAQSLAQQFESRSVEKSYLALVRGGIRSFSEPKGTIRSGLTFVDGRLWLDAGRPSDKKAKIVRRVAETDWEVLASSPTVPLTLVRLRPDTGLKHQLRIHMAQNLNTPILGDLLYSRSKLSSKITDKVDVYPDFMFLHSSQLSISRYRQTGAHKHVRVTIGAPLPGYFTRLCAKVKILLPAELATGGLWIDGERMRPQTIHVVQQPEEGTLAEIPRQSADDVAHKLEGIGGRWVGERL
ncbi:pseudouridine synthase [Sparassis latifolia]